MPCGSLDIPRIPGNEKASKASKSCKLCGQQELYWGIQGCANLCFPSLSVRHSAVGVNALPKSLQQNYCQHEKCQNQSFLSAVPFSPRHKVAILKSHPLGFSVYTKQKHLEMKSRISLLWEKERQQRCRRECRIGSLGTDEEVVLVSSHILGGSSYL